MKWKCLAVFFALFFTVSIQVPPANATSTYDQNMKAATALTVNFYNQPNQVVDPNLSEDWSSYITDDSKNQTCMVSSSDFSTASSSFKSAISNGGSWAVIQQSVGPNQIVKVFWSPNTMVLDWTSWANNGGVILSPTMGPIYGGQIETSSENSCGNGKPVFVPSLNSGTLLDFAQSNLDCQSNGTCDWMAVSYANGADSVFLFTGDPNYPDGYAGPPVQAEAPVLPTTMYNGTVDCGIASLEYLLIIQDGTTYSIPLSYESTYRASWTYDLTDDPYMIAVGCGNDIANSETPVSPMTSSNDWMCDVTSDPKTCVLS